MEQLILATGNPGKLEEFRRLLAPLGLPIVGLDPRISEEGDSYAANALLKAEAAARASGLPTLADDSGLEALQLDGFPGLRSARLASTQTDRNRALLSRLHGLPRPWRARFVCTLALVRPGQPPQLFTGTCCGEIVEPRPGNGFGYDPMFLVPETGRTFSEMLPEEKDRWSHRGAAVRAMLASGALRRRVGSS